MDESDWNMPEIKPRWRCQECNHVDLTKPMPRDRAKYYADPKPAKCSKCKSEALVPEGF